MMISVFHLFSLCIAPASLARLHGWGAGGQGSTPDNDAINDTVVKLIYMYLLCHFERSNSDVKRDLRT